MKQEALTRLAFEIENSKEPIDVILQEGQLTLKTEKDRFNTLCAVIGIAFGVLLIIAKDRAEHNLSVGLVVLLLSGAFFWRVQRVNKTLMIDLNNGTFLVSPNLALVKWVLVNILKVSLVQPIKALSGTEMRSYHRPRFRWTERIYLNDKLFSICLLEFDTEDKARKVLSLLKSLAV